MSGGFRYPLKSPSQAIFGREIVTWALDQSISPPHDGDVCDYLHNQSVSLIVFLSSLPASVLSVLHAYQYRSAVN